MGGGLSPLQFTHQCANYRNHCRGPGTLRHDGINTMLTRQRMQQRHCRKICALRRTHAHNRGSALGRLNEEQYFYEVLLFTRTKKSGVELSELTALISVPSCNTSAFAASMSSSSLFFLEIEPGTMDHILRKYTLSYHLDARCLFIWQELSLQRFRAEGRCTTSPKMSGLPSRGRARRI